MSLRKHPYLGAPGAQVINAQYIQVDMLRLGAAEKVRQATTEDPLIEAPLLLTYNIDSQQYHLSEGYQTYLKQRGGSLQAMMAQAESGEFPDFTVSVTLVKSTHKKGFGLEQVPLTQEEQERFIRQSFVWRERLSKGLIPKKCGTTGQRLR